MRFFYFLLSCGIFLFPCLHVSAQDVPSGKAVQVTIDLPIPWIEYEKHKSSGNTGDQITSKTPKVSTAKKDRHKGHWRGFYFHSSNLAMGDNTGGFSLNASRSYGWSWNFFQVSSTISRSKDLVLVTGLGYDWNKYRFQNGVTLQNIAGRTQAVPSGSTPETADVQSSIIKTQFLTIPLLLDWQFSSQRGKKAYISLGIVGNINTRSLSRFHYTNGDGVIVRTDINDLNFKLLHPELTARFGMGLFRFTLSYSPTSLIKNHRGPDMRPISFGIRIL